MSEQTEQTPSTALVAHRATLATDQRYQEHLPDLARQFAQSALCPDTWRLEPIPPNAQGQAIELLREKNERKVADLVIIGQSLAELDMRFSSNTISQCYAVHGRPGFMAQLQILLAARFGCHIIPLDEESDGTKAVVRVLGKDKAWHRVTVTMEEARLAKWPERNPNYKTMPDRMLMARAVTKAISYHCPECKMMLPPADLEEAAAWTEADDQAVAALSNVETGEMIPIPNAKKLVMQAIKDRSTVELSTEQAASVASMMWATHKLPNGQAQMLRSEVEALIATIPMPPPPAAADTAPEAASAPPPPPAPEPAPEPPGRPGVIDVESTEAERVPEHIRDDEPEAGGQMAWGQDEEPF